MPVVGAGDGPIRLCDLAEAPSLRIGVIVRSHQEMEGVVRWAHPTEVADPRPHLRDGELVCTVGSALLDEASVETFADAVSSAGAAGICFGVGDVHTQVPPTLVGACERLGLPLLSMAHGVPFTAINDYLAESRMAGAAAVEHEHERTWERDRVGRLLELIGDGLAGGAAVLPEIEASGLEAELLTVSAWPSGAARVLAERLPDGLVASTPSAALLVSASPTVIRELAHELALICGHSSQVSLDDLGRGITEARTALTFARRQGDVVGPERFTTFPALLAQQPLARLAAFVDELIRPLLDNDERHRGNLVVTLRSFIAHEASIQATAEATYLHVNTVRHRLGRIRSLVGRNPLVYSDLVALHVALAAYDRGQRRTGRVGTPS